MADKYDEKHQLNDFTTSYIEPGVTFTKALVNNVSWTENAVSAADFKTVPHRIS